MLYEEMEVGLGKRLMFGSDQMRWTKMIGKGIEAIQEIEFDGRTKKRYPIQQCSEISTNGQE